MVGESQRGKLPPNLPKLSYVASHFDPQNLQGKYQCPHFMGEETEAERFGNLRKGTKEKGCREQIRIYI